MPTLRPVSPPPPSGSRSPRRVLSALFRLCTLEQVAGFPQAADHSHVPLQTAQGIGSWLMNTTALIDCLADLVLKDLVRESSVAEAKKLANGDASSYRFP